MTLYRKTFVFPVLLILALTAAACGGGNAQKQPQGSKEQNPPKPITLKFFLLSNTTSTTEELKAMYEEPVQRKHPHISFEFIKNDSGIDKFVATNTKVDIIFGSFAGLTMVEPFALLGDMTDLVQKNNYDLNRFEQSYLDAIKDLGKGKLSGLPFYDLRLALYYNRDLFDRFGVPYPKDGMTWEEIHDLAKRLTREDGGVQYRGFIAGPNTLLSVNQFSLGYIDSKTGKANLQKDQWKTFFDTLVPLYTVPGYKPTKQLLATAKAQSDLFFNDKTAAMYVAFNNGAALANKSGLNWDLVSLPEMKGMKSIGSQPYPTYMALSATSENREEAFRAITQFVSDEVLKQRSAELALLAPVKSADVRASFGRDVSDWKGKNFSGVIAQKAASPMPYHVYNNTAQAEMGNAMIQVILGEKDVNTAIREAEERANQKIQAAVGK